MGTAPSPLLGVPIPDSGSDPENFGAQLTSLVTPLETFSTARYGSAAAGNSSDPSPTPGQVRWLDNPGRFEGFYPTYGWVPINWSKLVAFANTGSPTVNSVTRTRGVTEQKTIGPYTFPHLIVVTYRLHVLSDSGSTGTANAFLSVNGASRGYDAVSDFPGTATVVERIVNMGTAQGADATVLYGAIEKPSSDTSDAVLTADGADNRFTYLEALVTPYLTSA